VIALYALIFLFFVIGGGMWLWPILAGILGISSVTDKPGALRHIKQLMVTYDITPGEVETAFHAPAPTGTQATQRSKGDIAKTLFIYLGAIFILAGIGTYVGMFWDSMGSAMRVFVTLGVGYILLIVLVTALHEKKYPRLILPLTLACVFFMAGGWFVLIDEMFPKGDNWHAATLFVFGTMALHFAVLFGKYQRAVLALTALFFVYGFMHVGLDKLGLSITSIAVILGASLFLVGTALEKTPHRVLSEPALLLGACWLNGGLFDLIARSSAANWASLIIGVCVMLTAYGLHRADRHPRLIGLGYLFGSMMLYTGLFDLVENTPIELLYLAVTASLLYACVVLQSRTLLLTTVLAMLSYIGYFSAKHFVDSLGWPVTLVLMGIAFLGIGTIAIKLKQRI
jgi:hypothetical protein